MSIEGLMLDMGMDVDAPFTLAKALTEARVIIGSNRESDAYLFNGTMFVKCSVPEAIQIESALIKAGAAVILSRVGNESSFDFV